MSSKNKAVDHVNKKTEKKLKELDKKLYALALSCFLGADLTSSKSVKQAKNKYSKEAKKIFKSFEMSFTIRSEVEDNVNRNIKKSIEEAKMFVSQREASVMTKAFKNATDKNTLELKKFLKSADRTMFKSYQDNRQFAKEIDKAVSKVMKGEKALKQISREFEKNLNKKGISKVRTANGRHYKPKYWAEMNIRTEQNKIHLQTITDMFDELGSDKAVVRVSIHNRMIPRELCQPYQDLYINLNGEGGTMISVSGEVIHYLGYEETSYGLPAGIFGINCRHSAFPVFERIGK